MPDVRSLCRAVAPLFCAVMFGAAGIFVVGPALAEQSPQEPFPDKKPIPGNSSQEFGAAGIAGQPAFDWPWEGAPGTGGTHTFTSGPHGTLNGQLCLPGSGCENSVPVGNRSGLDFGGGGWNPKPMANGSVVFSGYLGAGFGYGVVVDHGTLATGFGGNNTDRWQTVYAHMANDGNLRATGPVTRADSLGTTACTGTNGATNGCGSGPHLHVDLRINGSSPNNGASWSLGTPVTWNGKVVSGWTISASTSNYNGYADRPGFARATAQSSGSTTFTAGAVKSLPTSGANRIDGCTTNTLAANDDGSTGAISLPFTANFFGTSYSSLYVNNNGNVTFGTSLGSYTPSALSGVGRVIIAPFWADVDTRSSGSRVVTYGSTTYQNRPAFCVNWSNVGYYSSQSNLLNTFQLVLVGRADRAAGDFDIVLNYDQVQWETGNLNGGINGVGGNAARIGYSNGTANGTYELAVPGSSYQPGASFAYLDYLTAFGIRNDGLIRSSKTSEANAGDYPDVKGRYVFALRNGNPPRDPRCDQGGLYGYYGYLYDVYGVSYAYYAYTTRPTNYSYYAYSYLNAAYGYANSARQAFDARRYLDAANAYYYAYLYSYYGYQFALADYQITGNIYSYYTYLYAYTAANYDIAGYSQIIAYCQG